MWNLNEKRSRNFNSEDIGKAGGSLTVTFFFAFLNSHVLCAVCLTIFILLFSPHPYLFFNQDRTTMTFLGFFINSAGDLVDPQTGQTLEKGLISKPLRDGLKAQGVDFATNIEASKK